MITQDYIDSTARRITDLFKRSRPGPDREKVRAIGNEFLANLPALEASANLHADTLAALERRYAKQTPRKLYHDPNSIPRPYKSSLADEPDDCDTDSTEARILRAAQLREEV